MPLGRGIGGSKGGTHRGKQGAAAEHDVDAGQHQERGDDGRDRRAWHGAAHERDLGCVAGVRGDHGIDGDARKMSAQHRAARDVPVGSRRLQQIRPGSRMTDGAEQLARDCGDCKAPVEVMEVPHARPDGIHGALSHGHRMPHLG